MFENEPVLNDGIIDVRLTNNPLKSIDKIQKSVMILDVCRTKLKEVNSFPPGIITFKAYLCDIEKITVPFPESLEELDLYKNELEDIPEFPPKMTIVDLSGNKLKELKNIPDTIRSIDISNIETLVLTDEQKTKLKSMKVSKGVTVHWSEKDSDTDDGIFNIFDADSVYSNYPGPVSRFNTNFNTGRSFSTLSYGGYGHYGGKYTKHNPNYIVPKKTFGI
jgi:Leucine-rich repeat (LRR) protein